jgi:hypothetical protein
VIKAIRASGNLEPLEKDICVSLAFSVEQFANRGQFTPVSGNALPRQPAKSGGAVESGRAGSTSYQSGLAAGKDRWIYRRKVVRDERIEELEASVIALGVVYAAGWLTLIAWAAI